MAQLYLRIDDQLKEQADVLFGKLGLNIGIAVNMFLSQAVRESKIPFEIALYPNDADPYFNEKNMARLNEAIQQVKDGKVIVKTMDELLEMEK